MDQRLMSMNGVRIFRDENLQKSIDEALSHLDENTHVAVVAHPSLDNTNDASFDGSLAVRMDDKWSISVAGYWRGKQKRAEAYVVWTP